MADYLVAKYRKLSKLTLNSEWELEKMNWGSGI
jgi:hypothetical protein